VFVHVDSPEAVDLQRRGDSHEQFETICTSPCDTPIPADGTYRISGDAVRSSRHFVFGDDLRPRTIHVQPSSSTAFVGGILLSSAGLVALNVAALWVIATAFGDGPGPADNGGNGARIGIACTAGAGVVALVAGLVLTLSNKRSDVSFARDIAH
jgi:hypothetical protein